MTFENHLKNCATSVDKHLTLSMDKLPDGELKRAMHYATTGGGKRLRAFLVLESAKLHNASEAAAFSSAVAIECIHAYSLVHDDLPCMDDDDLRRGKPTVHKAWDEATAVLVGDALQSLAFGVIAESNLEAQRKVELISSLAQASGAAGMVFGQYLDIAAESAGTPLNLPTISRLQEHKTGALIEWSACAGPRMAGADPRPMLRYARALGLAFQIADDILDVEGDEATAGKRLHKDEDAGKATFVSHLGLEGAKTRARELVADAIDALSLYSAQADYLRDAARFVVSRDK
ncbi:MAG: polyprenyl synthetase family protein [Paracoccaceae bacterium]